jgi:hypothetical protein
VTRFVTYCLFAFGTSAVFVPASLEVRESQGTQDSMNRGGDAEAVRRLTPSAQGLRKRFGTADSGTDLPDVFVLGPNLKLSVKYGRDRLACSISIEPIDNAHSYLPKERVSEILDDLAPSAMRGKVIAGYGEFRSSACGGVGMAAYENVFIGRWPNYCAPEHPGADKKAILQFTRDVCPNPYVEKKTQPPNSR